MTFQDSFERRHLKELERELQSQACYEHKHKLLLVFKMSFLMHVV